MRPYVRSEFMEWPAHPQAWDEETGELLPAGYRHVLGVNRRDRRHGSRILATRAMRKAYTSRRDLSWSPGKGTA